jgi:hypothetical protein
VSSLFIRRGITLILGFILLMTLINASSAQDKNPNFQDYDILFDHQDLAVKYGEYAEIEFYVNSAEAVEFDISTTTPVGMDLQAVGHNTVLLSGIPEFVDRFCFVLVASNVNLNKQAEERVCLVSEENENLNHPNFETPRHVTINKNSFERIALKLDARSSHLTPEFILGELPEGMDYQENRGELILSGRTSSDLSFEILVLASDFVQGEEFFVYKQFQIDVRPDVVDRYQCDIGYYYDETLGYCVQNQGSLCAPGTFYDPNLNSCVRYVNPPHVSCAPGSYYDHFLYRCVRNTYQRCPYNYEYDPYYARCVRQPYSCGIGYRYSYIHNSCIYVGFQMCGQGSHYSSYYNRCVSNYAACRPGYYWDGNRHCRITVRNCGPGTYYDPYYDSCRSRNIYASCGYGYHWNYSMNRCVRASVYSNRTCAGGTRYSPQHGRCIGHTPTPHRPTGPVVRPPQRPPVVVRPNRPVHTPHRPTGPVTRPTPPNRPGQPTPPPTTRPTPPNRPGQPTPPPTTRPTPPNRPGQPTPPPTTRPSPPSQPNPPTTRPTPPSQPNPPTTRPTPPSPPSRPTPPTPPTTRPSPPSQPNPPTTRPTPPSPPSRPTPPTPPTTRPSPPSQPNPPTTRPTPPSQPSRPTPPPSSPSRPGGGNGGGRCTGPRC